MKRILLVLAVLLITAGCGQGPYGYSTDDSGDNPSGVTGGQDSYSQEQHHE